MTCKALQRRKALINHKSFGIYKITRFHLLIVECADLIDKAGAFAACGMCHTLLHNVGGELVLRENQHLATHTVDQYGLVLLLAMLCREGK